jgi:LPS sulfotransferase NodH
VEDLGSGALPDSRAGSVRFVVVAARRTGSNLLCTLLDSHPAILCHHELFNPRGILCAISLRQGAFTLGSMDERDADPVAFVDRIWRQPQGHRCVGFKLTCGQAEPVLAHVLAERKVRKIVLRRRNRVKAYVSERIAERLDQWEVYDERQLDRLRPRVEVDAERLRRHVAEVERFYRGVESRLEATGQGCLRIDYEDLGSPGERARLLRFLGAEPEDACLEARSVKQNPRDLREVVANFDALAGVLEGDPLRDELFDLGS